MSAGITVAEFSEAADRVGPIYFKLLPGDDAKPHQEYIVFRKKTSIARSTKDLLLK